MPIAPLAIAVWIIFTLAYFLYGKMVGKFYKLNSEIETPAVRLEDGCDFIPTSRPVLLAQHFASIAAAGPVVGPIAAALAFGWAPTLLWIVFGCVFIGACHDLSALVASIKHDAKSLPLLAKTYLGPTAYKLSLGFIWMCLIYVIIAFTDVTAQQFLAKEEWNGVSHDIGGGVATSSILYLVISVLMGLLVTKLKVSLTVATVIFFPALIFIIYLGQKIPITFEATSPSLIWGVFILAYCAIASVLPMWLLLQPRGYLGGYFLYIILVVGLLGLVFGGFSIEYKAFNGFWSPKNESLYPFLFITVACGACSGFHGLVCSGTTSKQLRKETHAPSIGYGGMLLEGVVAVVALCTVMIWKPGSPILSKSPAEIYATGIAQFTHSLLGLPMQWGVSFGMLAFATFVYDTLDVATRLGRYLMEELLGLKDVKGRWFATLVTLGFPLVYVLLSPTVTVGGKGVPLWSSIWPLFGSSNQLLAALTLMLISVWTAKMGKKAVWLYLPAAFMFITAMSALLFQMVKAVNQLSVTITAPPALNFVISLSLFLLALSFSLSCYRANRGFPLKSFTN